MQTWLKDEMGRRQNFGNLRQLTTTENLIDFASNDYLGLAQHPHFADSVVQEWRESGKTQPRFGSTGSRLLTGNSPYAQNLESQIARFHGYEAGLLCGCGYMANLGLLSAIAQETDAILFDRNIHASMHDGIRLSRAKSMPFRHNDLDQLENRLKNCTARGRRFICIESIYSTDGSKADLIGISHLAKRYAAHLIVDEAHAVGICGPDGRGLAAAENLTLDVFAQITTFGKALGAYGAIILGSELLKQFLLNCAKPCIYTTALPFTALAAIKCSYALFPHLETERIHLNSLIKLFTNPLGTSDTPIQSIKIRGNHHARAAANKLQAKGFNVRALLSPTVRKGDELLRICLHAFNSEKETLQLLEYLDDHHHGLRP